MKAEADTVERARAWDDAKAKQKTEISRVNAKAVEWAVAESKERLWEKSNDVHMESADASSKIKVKAEAEREKIEKTDVGARVKAEAEIK